MNKTTTQKLNKNFINTILQTIHQKSINHQKQIINHQKT